MSLLRRSARGLVHGPAVSGPGHRLQRTLKLLMVHGHEVWLDGAGGICMSSAD